MLPLYLAFLAICGAADSYRLLAILPFPAKSHHFVFRPILEEMAKRGHEVVYVTGFPYQSPPPNITQIDMFGRINKLFQQGDKLDVVTFGEISAPMNVFVLFEIGLKIGEILLEEPQIQKLIQTDEHFDAVIFESYFVQEYLSVFLHKFGAVGIEMMPLGDCGWVNELAGLPDNTAYQLDFKNEYSADMDFFGRLYNGYISTTLTLMGYLYLLRMELMAQKYFKYEGSENRPWLWQLVSNRSVILTNSHFAVGYSVPLPPHRKEIGGINVKPIPEKLPKDLQLFLDDAESGVVYMSLGSNVNVSKVAKGRVREEFMNAFRLIPQRVLMKWESDFAGNLPENVRVSKWIPQQAVLAHRNVKLFITQGGILSLNEAVYYGVPVVGIPFFGDQKKNLRQVEDAGFGRILLYRNLTKESIFWSINEVLTNQKYKEEAMRRSAIFRDRRLSPLDEAVYWVEFAIRHPNALTPRAAFLPYFVLHQLDTKLACLVSWLVLAAIIYKISTLCKSRKSRGKDTQKSKKEKVKKH